MARRSDHTPEQLRILILDAAEDLLHRNGVDGLTVRAIAKQIGYAVGTLYSYFPAISDVALAVLARNLERLNEELRNIPPVAEPARRLHSYADIYLDFIKRNAVSWQALFDYRKDHPETETPDWYMDRIVDLTRMVAACFLEMNPGRAPQDCIDHALLLWSAIYGLTLLDEERRFDTIIGGDLRFRVHRSVDIHVEAWKER